MPEIEPSALGFATVLLTVAALPFLAIGVTAFAKIAVVLLIVRNALGIQQTPPNVVIYGVAIVLTAFVAGPLLEDLRAIAEGADLSSAGGVAAAGEAASEPVRGFLERYARPEDRAFFEEARLELGGAPAPDGSLTVLVPAFLTSELTRAFEIGFVLYLPFLAVDLIVSAVLVSLGMMMVSPTVVAIPLKLLVFVAVDGWERLVQGLVMSYA